MKKLNIKIVTAVLITTLILVAFPMTTLAAGPADAVIGNNYTLQTGQTLNNDLFVLGGNVNLMEGSTVVGNVLILGGNAQAAGTINGNLVVLGGSITMASTFVLNGNLTTAGGSISRAPGAQINGQVYTNENTPSVIFPRGIQFPSINTTFNPFFKVGGYFLGIFLWALVAMLVAMFLPTQLSRVSQTVLTQPLLSGGLGLMTIIILPIILVLLLITICLSPVSILGGFLLVIAWAYGLIAMGLEVGKRISAASRNEWHPALAAGLGTLVLMAILNGLSTFLPCIGWIPSFLAGIVGLGAVLLTQFGRKTYPQSVTYPGGGPAEPLPPTSGSPVEPLPPASDSSLNTPN